MKTVPSEGDVRIRMVYDSNGDATVVHLKFINGMWEIHKDDGPAVEGGNMQSIYFLEGKNYSKEEFEAKVSMLWKILYG